MSRHSITPHHALFLSTLTSLALALPGCIITGLPGDDDGDTAADSGSGGAADESGTGGLDDGSGDTGLDETGGSSDDDGSSGGIVNTCDEDEVGANVYQHDGSTAGEHWSLGIHVVNGTFTVNGPLSVEPCSIIQMSDGARITVGSGGSLQWLGEQGSPITVTSAKVSPAPGDWDHIRIQADAVGPDNAMEYVIVEYGGGSDYYGSIQLHSGAALSMSSSIVRHSSNLGMLVEGDGTLYDFEHNELTDNATGALQITPDHAGDLGVGTYSPNGVEGIFVTNADVAHDQTWLAHDAPYVATHGFKVQTAAGSAHLTVEAGAEIRMGDAADIRVGSLGGLTLAGTAAQPITIRSSKSTGAAGDWDEIRFQGDSVDEFNAFSHVIIEHGGGSYYGALWVQSGASLSMHDSTVRQAGDFGLLADDGAELRDFTGNTFTSNGGAAMSIGADEVGMLGAGTYGPNGVDGVLVRNSVVAHDATWLDLGVPYLANDGFRVGTNAGSAILTLSPGTRVLLGDAGDIRVQSNGGLTADGTADQHVQIGSNKASPAAGDWDELRFESGSLAANNVLRYTDLSHGGGSYYGMVWVQSGSSVDLDNVSFDASGGGCDVLRDGNVNAASTSYVECP